MTGGGRTLCRVRIRTGTSVNVYPFLLQRCQFHRQHLMAVQPWPKVGAPRLIGSARNRSLVRQDFLVHGQHVEEFVLHVTDQSSVLVFPVTRDLRVIAIELFRPGANKVLIELPGGNIESDAERLDKARVVKRELVEETGYYTDTVIPLFQDEVWFDPSVFDAKFYPFLALNCAKQCDVAEHEVRSVDLKTWFEMCFNGQVTDGKTLSTTLLAQPHLSQFMHP